jgi:hypothetical protein
VGQRRWGRRATFAIASAIVAAILAAPASAGSAGPSWVKRALALQYELSSDVGFVDAPWVGTHNSFNSVAELGPTLSAQDANQQITIADQLAEGMRSIEIDLHHHPSAESGGARAPVVCHARPGSEGHAGCTTEKTLGPTLDPIADWVRANPDQVLMIYVNDYLDGAEGYDHAAEIFERKLGFALHRPPPTGACTELPLDLTRDAIREAGAQVFVVSDCAPGQGWPALIFTWEEHEESMPFGFQDFPLCGPDYSRQQYDSTLIRYYEDATQLQRYAGNPDDGIDRETAAAMTRCGVDLIHFDMLLHDDPRLEGLVWSWAPGQPAGGRCSVQRVGENVPHGRWKSRRCGGKRVAACRKPSGRWTVTRGKVEQRSAEEACGRRKARFAVPRTGYESQLLRLRMERAGVRGAWLAQRRQGGAWDPLDPR